MNWDVVTKLLVSYPKSKLEEGQICESLHRTIGKRRASHQSTDHELEVHPQPPHPLLSLSLLSWPAGLVSWLAGQLLSHLC